MLELNKVHNVDALEFMASLPDSCVDTIFSDPPYKIATGGVSTTSNFGTKNKWLNNPEKLALYKSGKIFKHNDITEDDYIDPMHRVLKDGGHIYIMTNSGHLANIIKRMEQAGFIINNVLVMIKENAVINQHYMKNCEFTIFARKGYSRGLKDFGIKCAVQTTKKDDGNYHDCQKPIDYVKTLVWNSTPDDGIVFDPFMGSGTTAIACKSLGLSFLGCEIDEEYHKVCEERLQRVQGSLL